MFNGKVLKFIIEKGRSGLRAMIVEQEGVISAVVYCKQRTLMAAQLEKGKFERELADEGENLAREVGGMGLKDGDADATCDPNDGQATAATDHKDGDATPETDTTDKDKDPEASNGKAKKPEDVKPTKMLILQWRAEGMADEMANDELKDFIMPKDFH